MIFCICIKALFLCGQAQLNCYVAVLKETKVLLRRHKIEIIAQETKLQKDMRNSQGWDDYWLLNTIIWMQPSVLKIPDRGSSLCQKPQW